VLGSRWVRVTRSRSRLFLMVGIEHKPDDVLA